MSEINALYYQYIGTPIGELEVCSSQTAIRSIYFVDSHRQQQENDITQEACRQLRAYFGGALTCFDLPLQAQGTPFQHKVWQMLAKIPYGTTCSYADIAQRMDNPKAVRAVGAANGRNPLSIVVPCHRVIGANGKLTGYAGGLPRKSWLLNLEHAQQQGNLL
ncbi:methylated-DNA--[protein]-cysteine S-methyltransferase [Aliiglaciecola sp. LCG003]|uniref:methylated-DNA--[protein]-cysteine S-methyltransferase n=1 Tax=Aliiglaciecola sp. LCG003 TaxID=3053655 RepID=UPI002572F0AE|nr:methylated-DNA--[protein]-cysteine S-methyltransferase [Aliiglaciecola sp. LCG003]WJG09224.1 methylated-DNA--[protein]-cysteine S-methyltransferase [Aliiglaciecola sp. LCG003]